MIHVLSEDTYVFMLCESGRGGVQGVDGAVGFDNAGPQCLL